MSLANPTLPPRAHGWAAPFAVALSLLVGATGVLALVGALADDDTSVSTSGGDNTASDAPTGDGTGTGKSDAGDGTTVTVPAGGHAHSHGETDAVYADLPADAKAHVDIAREIAARYPTAADAVRDGWAKATISLKGIGSHYLKGGVAGFAGFDSLYDPNDPEILLFDGEGPDAPIAGISYLVAGDDPVGVPGDFDVWHRHNGVCLENMIVVSEIDGAADSQFSETRAQCEAHGGFVFDIANLTMLHVWVGEGYEDGVPIFAHDHPKLFDGVPG